MNKLTQKQIILNHLMSGAEISPLQAAREFNIYYLSKAIQLIRKQGVPVHARREYGEGFNHYYIPASYRKVG